MEGLRDLINDKLYLRNPIEEGTIKVLGEFLVLWSLYEAKFFDTNYNNASLKQKIEDGTISLLNTDSPLRYLKNRYLDNEDNTNSTFEKLQFRRGDYPDEVKKALQEEGTKQEITFAILVIVYRLRNNLFHGIKEAAIFNMQKENFEVASSVLSDLLWRREFLY